MINRDELLRSRAAKRVARLSGDTSFGEIRNFAWDALSRAELFGSVAAGDNAGTDVPFRRNRSRALERLQQVISGEKDGFGSFSGSGRGLSATECNA